MKPYIGTKMLLLEKLFLSKPGSILSGYKLIPPDQLAVPLVPTDVAASIRDV